jgi:hypothetical protein
MANNCIELLAKALMQNTTLKVRVTQCLRSQLALFFNFDCHVQNIALVGNDFDDSRAALLLEGSLVANVTPVSIDVPSAPTRPAPIALKDLEAIEYFPFLHAFSGT